MATKFSYSLPATYVAKKFLILNIYLFKISKIFTPHELIMNQVVSKPKLIQLAKLKHVMQ